MAKDFKLLSEVYGKIYEQVPAVNANTAAASPGAPITSAGTIGAVSDTAQSDQAKKVFDTAATSYLKALGVDDSVIKKFIETTHAQFTKNKPVAGSSSAPAVSTATYLPTK